jgi:hypothetical protein
VLFKIFPKIQKSSFRKTQKKNTLNNIYCVLATKSKKRTKYIF